MGQILANRRGVNRLEENIYVRVLREDQVTSDQMSVGVDAYIKNVGDDFVILGIENYIHPGSVINTEEVNVSVPEGQPFPEQVDPEKDGKPNTRAISRRMVREDTSISSFILTLSPDYSQQAFKFYEHAGLTSDEAALAILEGMRPYPSASNLSYSHLLV